MAERTSFFIAGAVTSAAIIGLVALGGETQRPLATVKREGESTSLIQPSRDGDKDGFVAVFSGKDVRIKPSAKDQSNSEQDQVLTDATEDLFRSGCDLRNPKLQKDRSLIIDNEEIADKSLRANVSNPGHCIDVYPHQ